MNEITRDPRPLIDALRVAFDDATIDDPDRRTLARCCLDGLGDARPVRASGVTDLSGTSRPPVCRHLARALANAERGPDDVPAKGSPSREPSAGASSTAVADVARALADLEPALGWYRRGGSETHGAAFHEGHANAFVVGGGSGGLDGGGAMVGVTLLAPGVRYPDHHHAPEELYLVLSPGHWQHGESPWFEPGIGGVVHNVPDIVHAMRSDAEPLLAIWCLLPTARTVDRQAASR